MKNNTVLEWKRDSDDPSLGHLKVNLKRVPNVVLKQVVDIVETAAHYGELARITREHENHP